MRIILMSSIELVRLWSIELRIVLCTEYSLESGLLHIVSKIERTSTEYSDLVLGNSLS